MVLAGYMTLSRGGVVEIAVALIVFVCLHPKRLELLPTLANSALGGLVLVFLASRRADLSDGLDHRHGSDPGRPDDHRGRARSPSSSV